VTTAAKRRVKLQSVTTNKPTHSFLQAGCPSCHPSNSVKALKETIETLMAHKLKLSMSTNGNVRLLSLTLALKGHYSVQFTIKWQILT